ncbi:hypothetical protein V5799_016178 [Amblyomma americanum]|uniref:Uncharacterized protein n=1 Tax=Amblyomma americanum TaxID=6943 RepID=A0AAQ4F6I7_AMBAM
MSAWERKFPPYRKRPDYLSLKEIRDIFGGLEASQLKDIFLEFLIDIDKVKEFRTLFKAAFLMDIRLLVDDQPLSLCYVLLVVALEAMSYIQKGSTLNSPTMRSKEVCNDHVFQSGQLWRVTYVAALASPARDQQLHKIFEETRRRFVEYGPFLRLMAVENDAERLQTVIGNITLMLPGDLVFQEPVVPQMSMHGFARNMFLALNFEFDAKKENARRGVPWIRDDSANRTKNRLYFLSKTILYVSSLGYGWLSSGTLDPLLADAAVIASRMAALMWSNVLKSMDWSRETKAALKEFR